MDASLRLAADRQSVEDMSAHIFREFSQMLNGMTTAAQLPKVRRQRCLTHEEKLLWQAASRGDLSAVHRLVPTSDIDQTDDDNGFTALHYASLFGHSQVVRALLEAGAHVNARDQQGWTPLMWASAVGHDRVVDCLIQHGGSTQARTHKGFTFDDLCPSRGRQNNNKPTTTTTQDEIDLLYYGPGFIPVEKKNEEEEEGIVGPPSVGFVWDQCRYDQMLVFHQDQIQTILDHVTLDDDDDDELLPADVIFLCCRFAHYYYSRELLYALLDTALARISKVVKSNRRNTSELARWMANLLQLLTYLRRDLGLRAATVKAREQIGQMLEEAYRFYVVECLRRLDEIIEPSMLDDARFSFLFYRRKSSNTQSPQSLISSIMHELHPDIANQVIHQCCRYMANEMLYRVLNHHHRRRYRSKAMQIRRNISVFEQELAAIGQERSAEWMSHFRPLVQCLEQDNSLESIECHLTGGSPDWRSISSSRRTSLVSSLSFSTTTSSSSSFFSFPSTPRVSMQQSDNDEDEEDETAWHIQPFVMPTVNDTTHIPTVPEHWLSKFAKTIK